MKVVHTALRLLILSLPCWVPNQEDRREALPEVDTAALRTLAGKLRDHAHDVRSWGTTHVNESLSMQWHSTSSQAFAERTSSDQAALFQAAARVDLAADAMSAHADAVDAAEAEAAAEAAAGDGPGRAAN